MIQKTLYVSDMDGTLLNDQSVLSPQTISLLNEAIDKHQALFTIATARTPATIVDMMRPIHTSLPLIVMAGAAFWDNHLLQYKDVQAIPTKVIEQLLLLFAQNDIHPFVYRRNGNQIQAYHINHFTPAEEQFIGQRISTPFKRLITTDMLLAENPDECMLIFCMGEFTKLRAVTDQLEAMQIDCSPVCYHDIFNESQGILEIYASGTTKASAIHRLAKQVQAERIVVFGDNLNDLPMMRNATHSLAVSNAFDEVKQAADEIIGSNNEDAVAQWIMTDILQSQQ